MHLFLFSLLSAAIYSYNSYADFNSLAVGYKYSTIYDCKYRPMAVARICAHDAPSLMGGIWCICHAKVVSYIGRVSGAWKIAGIENWKVRNNRGLAWHRGQSLSCSVVEKLFHTQFKKIPWHWLATVLRLTGKPGTWLLSANKETVNLWAKKRNSTERCKMRKSHTRGGYPWRHGLRTQDPFAVHICRYYSL